MSKRTKILGVAILAATAIVVLAMGNAFTEMDSKNGQTILPNNKQLLAKTADDKILLFGEQINDSSDLFSGLYLSFNGEIKYFNMPIHLTKVTERLCD